MRPQIFPLKYRIGLLFAILFGILYFGLGPESIWFPNGVKWIPDQPGIRFGEYGCVFTNLFSEANLGKNTDADGFSIEIALEPAVFDANGFAFVWALHGGQDRNQLVMGQWRSHFIVMNGDDYDHKRKTKRITADADPLVRGKRFITITSGPEGTGFYVDGRLARTKNDLTLKIPTGDNVRFLIGNSVSCKHSWRGDVYGLALYRYSLTDSEVARHFAGWEKEQNFTFAEKETPFLLYVFDEKTGTRVIDHAGGNRHLHLPLTTKVLERQFLAPPRSGIDVDKLFSKDVIINLMGFIPFGFVLCATIAEFRGRFRQYAVFIALGTCFFASLGIEIAQAGIPSRNSDLLDLVFNTIGGLIGAVACTVLSRRFDNGKHLQGEPWGN